MSYILGMDWISPYRAILDHEAKTISLVILGRLSIEWTCLCGSYPSKVIFYIRA